MRSHRFEPPLNILIADDHPIFRIGLRVVIEQNADLHVVGEASSPEELAHLLASQPCDLLVTDFMMPADQQNDGLRLIERLRRGYPALPVVVVTMLNHAGLFRSILDLGVAGLLSKASLAGELPAAIREATNGGCYVARSVREALLEARDGSLGALASSEPLSPRELEVLRLLATGATVGEIAAHLNRSKQTVSAQKVSAMRKLGLTNDAALFIYLQEHGLA